ncbi:hypothetical protein A3F06_02335 [candidate division TM6 bacterium RIFCSPHIGHO2_12_FULL_36_22]|nr:MAG: hypothetical protein A3F06_02335 [candidate division TM6 bacterium RIFCSPHIGHO2_12_FULL_36_22]
MNKINKLKLSLIIISFFNGTIVQAQFPINLVRPYDIDLHWAPQPAGTWEYGMVAEVAPSINAYNAHGSKTNVLQLWNNTVDSLAMLRGFPANTEIGQLDATLAGVSDNGVRGHLIPTASLNIWDANFSVRYFFPCYVSLGLYLPLFHMSLDDINFFDLTQNFTADDLLVKELLTNNFPENVRYLSGTFGCENKNVLDIGNPWNKTGIGDLTILGVWSRDFPQVKPVLKNVRLTGRLGVTVPTGMRTNENILFPIPYGNDGALGVVFGLNIELQWWRCLRGGVQADFWRVFGDTRDRRVKTDAAQTDLVLLARIPTYKTWGFTRRYTLYAELGDFERGYSVAFAYQYFNKGPDALTVVSNQYLTATAETASNIEEWKLHNFIVDVSVRCGAKDTPGRTRISFFYKHPFNGTRAIAAKTLGVRLILDF